MNVVESHALQRARRLPALLTPALLLPAAAVLLLAVLAAAPAHAQVELIVRLRDGASGRLAQRLRGGGGVAQRQGRAAPDTPPDTALAALIGDVQRVQPVFQKTPPTAGKTSRKRFGRAPRRQPIPAFTLQLPDSASLRRAQKQLAQRSDVAYVQPNHRYHTFGSRAPPLSHPPARAYPSDPLLDSLRYFPVVHVPEAHEVTTGDESIRVGIVDTGIFFEHPDLKGQVWVNPGEDLDGDGRAEPSDFNGIDDDGNGFVDDVHGYDFVDRPGVLYTGDYADPDPDPSHDRIEPASPGANQHGTNVAGIIAAAAGNGRGIAGVAPGVKLVPLRALAGDGNGTDDDIAAAIVYAADLGVDVLNFSFGDVYYSRLMEEAVRYAAQRGVVMAASAGNNGGGALQAEHYPSDYPEVISVAQLAVRVNLEGGLVLSIPGKYGTGLDLSAPGTQIFTTTLPPQLTGPEPEEPTSEDFYTRASGSSFAAPQVAATAALLRSLDADLSPEAIRAIVTASAKDLEDEGWDQRTGAGLLDVGSAVRRALPARTEITRPESDGGIRDDEVAVLGSALDPAFRSFSVYYAKGDTVGFTEDDLDFTRIAGPVTEQVLGDTLATWNTGALSEGLYTLRLATKLQDGSTVEERRRVYVDRSPPELRLRVLDKGMIGRQVGVLADVQTDDLSTVVMEVTKAGRTFTVKSDRRARRHGLTWASPSGDGGPVRVTLRATNVAGLTTTVQRALRLPPSRLNTALFDEETLDVPAGLLLPQATDFDGDGLRELTLTAYGRRRAYTDRLRTYEWDGDGFALADTLVTNFLPRDTGDTDGDGLQEILFQVGGASLLIEQRGSRTYPNFSQIAFIDTTGQDADSTVINAALLTDLDTDGRGEVLGYDGDVWRLVEAKESGYESVATLENPTVDSTDAELQRGFENGFGAYRAAAGDFDGDGRRGFVATDNGGDFILYEAQGDDEYRAVWTHPTPRYAGAGRRVAAGDFDGDGTDEFVTYTRPFLRVNSDVEREPLLGRYYLWDSTGDDRYRLADSLSIKGVAFTGYANGAMRAVDLDGDGRDELAVVDPPALYVFRYDARAGGLVPLFYRGVRRPPTQDSPPSDGLVSPVLVAADFGSSGAPDLVAPAADGRMRRFVYQRPAATAPPPRWVQAAAPGARRVRLRWRAPGADSVTVYRGAPGQALDRYATVRRDSSLADTASSPRRYVLRAQYGEAGASPLSEVRTVRPGAPPAVAEVRYPSPQIARLRFTRRLDPGVRAEQFTFEGETGEEQTPAGLVFSEREHVLALRFEEVAGARGTLRWHGLQSAEGLPVAQSSVALAFPERASGTLIVEKWDILDAHRVALVFSAPLAPSAAADTSHYTVTAPGRVASVDYDETEPARVVVRLSGIRVGPTGRENALTVTHLRGRAGEALAPEGHTVRLSEAARDLADVYVYPNPYHAGRASAQRLTVAGLPPEATVKVISVEGTLVRTLEERGSDGGLDWDLKDRRGEGVPAGVYLIRVDAPGADPVLKKAAVIR